MKDKTTATAFPVQDIFGPVVEIWPAMVLLSVVLLVCVLNFFGFDTSDALQYRQGNISLRWLTAHFAHLGTNHALLNAAAGLMLLGIFRDVWRAWHWWLLGGAVPLAISATFYLFDYSVSWYVGLSGALHGWFAWGCVLLLIRERGFAVIALIGLVAKLNIEYTFPNSLPSEEMIGGNVVTAAHRLGALYGFLFAVVALILQTTIFKQNKSES